MDPLSVSYKWSEITPYNSYNPSYPFIRPFIGLILLMDEILHQLRLVDYLILYRDLNIPDGAGFLPSTACT